MAATAYTPDGAWTIRDAAEQLAALCRALADGACTLDLSRISEFDTAGVQILVAALHTPLPGGAMLTMRNPSPPVRELLQRYGLQYLAATPEAS